MSSYSLLMVLLVLTCLQSFTTTQDPKAPGICCFTFQEGKVPVKYITKYEETHHACNPGIVFIMKSGRRVCADPGDQWVKEHMNKLDLCLYRGTN